MSDFITLCLPPDYWEKLYAPFPPPVRPSAESIAKAAELRANGYPVSSQEIEQWAGNGVRVTLE